MQSLLTFKDPNSLVDIRVTGESPKRASVIDVIRAVTGQNNDQAACYLRRMKQSHFHISTICTNIKFGYNQKPTPAADVFGIVEIVLLLPGKKAGQFRKDSAELVVRFLGGDRDLIQKIVDIDENTTEATNPFKAAVAARKRKYAALEDTIKLYLVIYHNTQDLIKRAGVTDPRMHGVLESKVTTCTVGMTATDYKTAHGAKKSQSARQLMSTTELALAGLIKSMQADEIKRRGCNGDAAVILATDDVCKRAANFRLAIKAEPLDE